MLISINKERDYAEDVEHSIKERRAQTVLNTDGQMKKRIGGQPKCCKRKNSCADGWSLSLVLSNLVNIL